MQLVRVYTKKRGNPPDFKEPCVLTMGRNGCTVESVCRHLHRDLVREFKCAPLTPNKYIVYSQSPLWIYLVL